MVLTFERTHSVVLWTQVGGVKEDNEQASRLAGMMCAETFVRVHVFMYVCVRNPSLTS